MSPRSSKMEPGYKSYHHFCVDDSSWPNSSAQGRKIRHHAEPHTRELIGARPNHSAVSKPSGLQSGPAGPGAEPSGLQFSPAELMTEIPFELLPTARFPPTYKYPFFLLEPVTIWVSLTSIVDFESLPSLLQSSHAS
jgi:hypothetical protein